MYHIKCHSSLPGLDDDVPSPQLPPNPRHCRLHNRIRLSRSGHGLSGGILTLRAKYITKSLPEKSLNEVRWVGEGNAFAYPTNFSEQALSIFSTLRDCGAPPSTVSGYARTLCSNAPPEQIRCTGLRSFSVDAHVHADAPGRDWRHRLDFLDRFCYVLSSSSHIVCKLSSTVLIMSEDFCQASKTV